MDSSIAETSKKNPETSKKNPESPKQNPEPPQQNPETSEQKPEYSSFLFYPLNELKHAIDALIHANPEGMGIMEVVANRARILCQMPVDSGLCYLDLNHFNSMLMGLMTKLMDVILKNHFKKVPLKEIFNILDGSDDKIVEIEHADGSDKLTFTIGIERNDDVEQEEGEKSVTVHGEVDDGSRVMDPLINPIIEPVSISKQDMMKIIQQVEADESTPVVFEMLNGTVSIKVEQEELTSFKYEENDANRGITHARFQFVQCECLKKALVIAEDVLLCLGTDPRVLTLRFNLGELGDIVYRIIESIDPSVQNPEPPKQHPESPKQNPETSQASSSMADQEPTDRFSFEIHPASNLKHAIEVLSTVQTRDGCIIFEVSADGMKIIASDKIMKFVCYLYLKAGDLINFDYNKPLSKSVTLNGIRNALDKFDVGDTIKIQGVDEELLFKNNGKHASVMLSEDETEVTVKIHRIEVVIDCNDFREIIERVTTSKSKFDVFEIADGFVSIKVGDQAWTNFEYQESVATTGLKYRARFRFVHCEFLRKALPTAKGVRLCLVTKPPDSNSLIVRFNRGELGELACMYLFADPGTVEKIDPLENSAYSFSLQIHPASKLKYAIDALSYANPQGWGLGGWGRIEVAANGMKILCGDKETQTFCYLDFKAGSLINFYYNKDFKKDVCFRRIFHILRISNDGDIITIKHTDGSNELTLMIGERPCEDVVELRDTKLDQKKNLLDTKDDYKLPVTIPRLDVTIDWEHMRQIIRQVEANTRQVKANTSKVVVFNIDDDTLFIKVGQKEWKHKNVEVRGSKFDARFLFVHCKFLKKALLVAEEVRLYLGIDPQGSRSFLRLQFKLGELGDLVYATKSIADSEITESTDP